MMLETSQTRLYFAYGFNLNLQKMGQTVTKPRVLGVARLANHKIGFYGHSAIWDGAVETVVPDNQSEVWGILYQLDAYAWDQLDNFADARLDGAGRYFHYPVAVFDEQNMLREAFLYKKSQLGAPKRPSAEYLDIIIQGAQEQGLPESYIATLRAIPAKPAAYPVPRQTKRDRKPSGGCDGCST